MTNKDRWDLYTRDLPSPQNYLDFGFYFMIGAALQRRVWFYGEGEVEDGRKLFPNNYLCLVGDPGIGKGIVLKKIAYILKYHKYSKGELVNTSVGEEKPCLIPIGADSITFEELLDDIAKSTRGILTPERKPYIYSSYCFLLEELDSLFRKRNDEIARFLKNAYDCGEFDRKTKHQGKNLLRKLCLSLFACTQPDYLREAADNHIFDQGFSSRTVFIFEAQNRFDKFHISDAFDSEQKDAINGLLTWISSLAKLYGEITYEPGVRAYLEDWYQIHFIQEKSRTRGKMLEYMARKKVILLKLAAGIHFSENLTYEIGKKSFDGAIELLAKIEPAMRAGLSIVGKNPLHSHTRKMLNFIKDLNGTCTRKMLVMEFVEDLNMDDIDMCLKELEIGYGLKIVILNKEKCYLI